MKQSVKDYKRIVIKIGASLLDADLFKNIIAQVSALADRGKEIIIVSSGAIALGMEILRLKSRPRQLSYLQAAAAIGQNALMDGYSRAARDFKLQVAQVLLTWEDFDDRKRYLNAKNTLQTLLRLKSVAVINENDTVSTEEIKFGDNDRLSALVATLINADLLIILSDVDGLLDKEKKVIRLVDEITSQIKALAHPTTKETCVGGMNSKMEAVKIAVGSGIPCVIANGRSEHVIERLASDPLSCGTLFLPKKGSLAARQRWIAFGTKAKGKIIVDDGAKKALINRKSLLSVGVTACEGNFFAGDIVSLHDKENCEIGRGKVALASKELDKVKGRRHEKEIIHRDNIVIF